MKEFKYVKRTPEKSMHHTTADYTPYERHTKLTPSMVAVIIIIILILVIIIML